jgi:hypothetical protein
MALALPPAHQRLEGKSMHTVEAAWRKFRNSDHHALLTRSLELRRSFLDYVPLEACPAEVALPVGVPWSLVAAREAQARGESSGSYISTRDSIMVNTVHVWAAYRQAKTIYQIEPQLAQCLARSPWPAETPTAALRLPSLCPVLAIPREDGRINHVAASYDLLTGAEASGALELRLSMLTVDGDLWIPISILHLARPTLSECVEAAAAEARAHGGPEWTAETWRNELAGLALTLLLYLAGEPDLVRMVHPGEKPLKAKIARTDPERYRDLAEPSLQAVGKTFAHAIERWEIEHRGDDGVTTGYTVRPHMRRAHSHLYWTGAGRKQLRVKFLLPISVRGGALVEEPENAQVAHMRRLDTGAKR